MLEHSKASPAMTQAGKRACPETHAGLGSFSRRPQGLCWFLQGAKGFSASSIPVEEPGGSVGKWWIKLSRIILIPGEGAAWILIWWRLQRCPKPLTWVIPQFLWLTAFSVPSRSDIAFIILSLISFIILSLISFSPQSVSKCCSIPTLPALKWIWSPTINLCAVHTIRTGKGRSHSIFYYFFKLLMELWGVFCTWMALRKPQSENWRQCPHGYVNLMFVT